MADTAKKTAAPPAQPPARERTTAEANAIIRKAEKGDAAALVDVREMLKRPGIPDIMCGNAAKEALRLLVKCYAGDNMVAREATVYKLVEMRAELSGPAPTALEKLLVERVLATWLHLHTLERAYAANESMSLALGLYYQKCLTTAQKRYVAAIKGLADVRKLALPVLQLNIAKKQVNIAAATVRGAPAAE